MKAYHGNKDTKSKYIERMKAHMAADELVRGNGIGFEDGKGCAVGCTLNKYDHLAFEIELGIPTWVAHLLDTLHENTSDNIWPTYSLRFLETIKPGVDLEAVKAPFLIFILRHCKKTVATLSISKKLEHKIIKSLNGSIELYEQPMNIAASNSARAYALDVAALADTARAYAAANTRAATTSYYAARTAAHTNAANAAHVASTAFYAAGSSAVTGARDEVISDATRNAAIATTDSGATYDIFAEKLIELIENCEVQH